MVDCPGLVAAAALGRPQKVAESTAQLVRRTGVVAGGGVVVVVVVAVAASHPSHSPPSSCRPHVEDHHDWETTVSLCFLFKIVLETFIYNSFSAGLLFPYSVVWMLLMTDMFLGIYNILDPSYITLFVLAKSEAFCRTRTADLM